MEAQKVLFSNFMDAFGSKLLSGCATKLHHIRLTVCIKAGHFYTMLLLFLLRYDLIFVSLRIVLVTILTNCIGAVMQSNQLGTNMGRIETNIFCRETVTKS